MLNVFNILLLNKYSIEFTLCVKISEQYLEYYAKYSFFDLKESKSKVTKAGNLGISLRQFLFIYHAEQ